MVRTTAHLAPTTLLGRKFLLANLILRISQTTTQWRGAPSLGTGYLGLSQVTKYQANICYLEDQVLMSKTRGTAGWEWIYQSHMCKKGIASLVTPLSSADMSAAFGHLQGRRLSHLLQYS